MSCSITLTGQIVVNPNACSTSCGACSSSGSGVATTMKPLTLQCSGSAWQGVSSTDCPVRIATTGQVGAAYVDLPAAESLDEIDLLYVNSDAQISLRIGADVARLAAVGASWPVTFAGGEAFDFSVDSAPVLMTFSAGSTTAQQAANAINAAAASAGYSYLPCSVGSDGQLVLVSNTTGNSSLVVLDTELAAIGFSTASIGTDRAAGSGEDISVYGAFYAQFTPATTRVQVSGTANIDVLAAKR